MATVAQIEAAHSAILLALWNATGLRDELLDDRGNLTDNFAEIAQSSLELWQMLARDYREAGNCWTTTAKEFGFVSSCDRGCAHATALTLIREIESTVRAILYGTHEPYKFLDFVEALPKLRDALRQLPDLPADLINRMKVELAKAARTAEQDQPSSKSEKGGGDASKPPELKGAPLLAYLSYQAAESVAERPLEDREAYDLLYENGFPTDKEGDSGELTGYKLPAFDNWSRYLRTGRAFFGEQKYEKRIGRSHGKSIVHPDEI